MEVQITGRHFEVSDDLKELTRKKVEKLKRYFPRLQLIEVVLGREKYRYQVDVLVRADHFTLQAEAEDEELQNCLDEVLSRIERQLRRQKEKIVDKKHIKKSII